MLQTQILAGFIADILQRKTLREKPLAKFSTPNPKTPSKGSRKNTCSKRVATKARAICHIARPRTLKINQALHHDNCDCAHAYFLLSRCLCLWGSLLLLLLEEEEKICRWMCTEPRRMLVVAVWHSCWPFCLDFVVFLLGRVDVECFFLVQLP